jgi:hypothetical protein
MTPSTAPNPLGPPACTDCIAQARVVIGPLYLCWRYSLFSTPGFTG